MQLTAENVSGRSVLDLGSYTGAVFFEIARLGAVSVQGIESDVGKASIAERIAALSGLTHLDFRQENIDQLNYETPGEFDIVMCLAMEARVEDCDRLFQLLKAVSGGTCYFETNGRADESEVREQLKKVGFNHIESLGVSKDDIVAGNHKRLLLRAMR